MRILIVDDNVDAADALAVHLELKGHETRVSAGGSGALTEAKTFRPELVILDTGLAGPSGYELAQHLRDGSYAPATLVALSDSRAGDDRRETREAGFEHHLSKPIDARSIEPIVAALAERRRERID